MILPIMSFWSTQMGFWPFPTFILAWPSGLKPGKIQVHNEHVHFLLLPLPCSNTFLRVWVSDSQFQMFLHRNIFMQGSRLDKRNTEVLQQLMMTLVTAIMLFFIHLQLYLRWERAKNRDRKRLKSSGPKQLLQLCNAVERGSFISIGLTDLMLAHFLLLV